MKAAKGEIDPRSYCPVSLQFRKDWLSLPATKTK